MGLFDRIKKSLFGKKDEDEEEKKEEQPKQEEEEKQEEESAEPEKEESAEETAATEESEAETTSEAENEPTSETEVEPEPQATEVENSEESEPVEEKPAEEKTHEAESETEEEQPAEQENDEEKSSDEEDAQEKLYEKGLEKTNKGFGARLNAFFARFRSVDEDFFDDLEDLLIESDVGFETAEQLTDELREEAKLQNAKSRDDLKQVIVEKLVDLYDQGGQGKDEKLAYDPDAKPNVYLFVGVNGAGKTTTIGKLAKRFKDEGKSVILAAADTFRAGAVEQLEEWGKRVGVPVVTGKEKADPASVVYDATERAIKEKADYLLVDTAGRLQNKKNLMAELEKIQRTIKKLLPEQPAETLLVLDGSTGQNALLQAKDFDKTTKLTGLVLTKLDGSSKGGVVLAIRNEMKLPVKLVGLGEKAEDLADFDAANYAIGLFHGLV
ncbi:MAG: signal recognition particle-docking protein FtsY [Lactobacillus amylovorus]|mgnify:FL=1|uniref:signal recognition particle-docking protein FtsY n=1 Tax=Lactobacillus amylovorus TaxID=1604 RepID=UPI0022DFF28A|nr:signal recognition particle-docking protein FtsY [Lactobacillus amylovorus]MCI7160375.1 signal recognition particle-docking protein FtsY [Lactobacillus amylovorus]MDB6221003.1 signal recognition particle-docking protein FtsY [Lactobacillus amylovorus]MDB6241073.1 signal recognition particle-docking protein FtsY [Lactobacillus amylovorus]MDB6244056.1 signal recognition particle-docking protein FtsY [Lactobacillus amylovorus]MDY5961355.1 signal recognition particle-docking protein FtsY [Lacto